MWKIEKTASCGDYTYAVVPDHPKAIKHGYVLEHRVVVENSIGRILTDDEVVHHINGDKKDNRLENLELMLLSDHSRHHTSKRGRRMVKLRCPWCNETFDKELRQSFLQKGSTYTCCSPSCRGKFSRYIQINGNTPETQKAIKENLIARFRLYK